jgi:uncharacterized protein YjiS (DUF1127 family)
MPTMTNVYASTQGRSLASGFEADLGSVLDRARHAWMQHRAYRRTLTELRALSDRTLRDLDFDRDDLSATARRDVYGR